MVTSEFDVIIVGAGPAGASVAIELAQRDRHVLLVEQKQFPRPKLCGEFISPECYTHFDRLGVAKDLPAYGPASIQQTTFYSQKGSSVTIPSRWFGLGPALGLSRAALDDCLLKRASRLGVTVMQNTFFSELVMEADVVRGVKLRSSGTELTCLAPLTIDATGRARVLASKATRRAHAKANLVAFKAHLKQTRGEQDVCEIYSYPRGYGGLSTVEDGLYNLCFITAAEDVRKCHSDPVEVIQDLVRQNRRANYTLEHAEIVSEWIGVSLDSFGKQDPTPAVGLIAVGDAAAFIDPFTGSGILMALESGHLAADVIVQQLNKPNALEPDTNFNETYAHAYRRRFQTRLMFCSLLRRVAFKPRLAEITIGACHGSQWLRNRIALATRSNPAVMANQIAPPE